MRGRLSGEAVEQGLGLACLSRSGKPDCQGMTTGAVLGVADRAHEMAGLVRTVASGATELLNLPVRSRHPFGPKMNGMVELQLSRIVTVGEGGMAIGESRDHCADCGGAGMTIDTVPIRHTSQVELATVLVMALRAARGFLDTSMMRSGGMTLLTG
jgi:hypothetical protein